jgi:hypothetical protein
MGGEVRISSGGEYKNCGLVIWCSGLEWSGVAAGFESVFSVFGGKAEETVIFFSLTRLIKNK